MSKFLYVYSRTGRLSKETECKLSQVCDLLVPDNLDASPVHRISAWNDTAYAVTMPSPTLYDRGKCILLGILYQRYDNDLFTVNHPSPDGNYALIRNDTDHLEILTDVVASRTIWYYKDEDLFLASSSQRAMVCFLNSFEFDERVIPWILSSGSLGPELSWDRRFKRMPPDASLLLSRKTWGLELRKAPVLFNKAQGTYLENRQLLSDAISKTIKSLNSINLEDWVIPLSGGYDSRAILYYLNKHCGKSCALRTVTWGTRSSLKDRNSDGVIAEQLAHCIGSRHEFFPIGVSLDNLNETLDRYLHCSEGRIDNIDAYMDGMQLWKKMRESGCIGVVRGDVSNGATHSETERIARRSLGCSLCDDFSNLKEWSERYSFPSQQLPSELERLVDEDLIDWQHRLYETYRIPTVLAALSDIKFSYLEQISPLLSRNIVETIRNLPIDLRIGKRLLKIIVKDHIPEIPFATASGTENIDTVLESKPFQKLVRAVLDSKEAEIVFPRNFLRSLLREIAASNCSRYNLKFLPYRLCNSARFRSRRLFFPNEPILPKLDSHRAAFRAFIIVRMHQILREDSANLGG